MSTEESCTQDCSSCKVNCSTRTEDKQSSNAAHSGIEVIKKPGVKKVIGVASGKGGVGKSLVCSLLAVMFNRLGHKTAILDADITGPSIPRMFGLKADVHGSDEGIVPPETKTGIKIMSVNLLLDDERMPVVWRGPVIAGTVKQFWSDVAWGDVDYMFVDMPPGTGDVPLTVFQSILLDGLIVVATPQELVSMIVAKAVKMAQMMKIPVLGLIENMSYVKCPDCECEIDIFGRGDDDKIDKEKPELELLGKLPLDPKLAALCDRGMIELVEDTYLENAVAYIEKKTV